MLIDVKITGFMADRVRAKRQEDMITRLGRGMARAGIVARRAFKENFIEQGRPDKWVPLAPSTMAQKTGMYNAGKLRGRKPNMRLVPITRPQPMAPGGLMSLVRTGDLLRSVTNRGVKGNITRYNPTDGSMILGSNLEYAGYQNDGTRATKKRPNVIPARPFLILSEEDYDAMMEAMVEEIYPEYMGSAFTVSVGDDQ